MSADAASVWESLDESTRPFVASAGAMIVAGGLVATVNSAAPFGNGSWAAAYLVLVGGVAQLALALGRRAGGRRLARAELALWNAGNAGVLGGVLADLPGLVLAASAMLLIGLACFALEARGGGLRRRGRILLYDALIAFLATSVAVGAALALR